MPKNSRQGGRAPKNFDPRYGERAKKAGKTIGRGHRGYRAPDAEAPKKGRWSAEDRAGRDTAREIRDGRSPRRDDRGSAPRNDRGFAGRDERRSFGDRDDRFSRGRDDRRFSGDRDERRAFGDRDDRRFSGDRDERRSFGDRAGRGASRGHDDFRGRSGGRFGAGATRRDGDGFRSRNERTYDGREDRGMRNDRRDEGYRGHEGRSSGAGRDFRPTRRDGAPSERRSLGDRRDAPRFGERRDGGAREGRSFGDREGRGFEPRERRSFDDRRDAGRRDDRRDGGRRDDHARGSRADWNATPKQDEVREDVVLERLQAESVSAADAAETTFDDLGLGQNIVRVLGELGAERPFPIQAATIPVILEGRDTLGRGRTGSGKTIAFGAPLVERVLRSQAGTKRAHGRAPSALILAPTRELALQIDRTIQPIARSVGLFTTQIYGGVPQARQVGALRKGVDIVIGTPGRIEDLQQQGKLDLSQVQVAVLDEADHMCELGFLEPVQRILRSTGDGSQKLLFSATLDAEVEALVKEFLVKPAVYEVAGEDQDSGTIDHRVLVIDHREKGDILSSLVDRDGKTLVFTRTRAYAEMLAEEFEDAGIAAVALHGDLNQGKRTRNLQKLSSGKANVLVATDVAARGIHIDDIDLVIQADAPMEYKTYLHRAGRTGRAGRSGTVVTLTTRGRTRRIGELLERAEIRAPFQEARPGDDLIDELAGRLTIADLTS